MSGHAFLTPSLTSALSCRILFAEAGRRRIVLDCVATSPGRNGLPFVVVAALPRQAWAQAAGQALIRWADDSREVRLRLRPRSDTMRIDLSDGRTRILLDLVEAVRV